MKLLSGPLSMFGAKAELAAIEKGIEVDVEFVPFSLQSLYSPKHPSVTRINPKAQVPVLMDKDVELFDSTQIFEYFEHLSPEPPLWPGDAAQRASARLLELKSDEIFFPDVVAHMPRQRQTLGETALGDASTRLQDYFRAMDERLSTREYLAGPLSYADLAFYPAQFFARFLGAGPSADLVALDAWRRRMNARTSVKQVMGKMAGYLQENGIAAQL